MRNKLFARKLLPLLLILSLFVEAFALTLNAETEGDTENAVAPLEMVFLIDVSGSMVQNDPTYTSTKTRMSLEAVESFSSYCISSKIQQLFISVVIYNANVLLLMDKTDVTTSEGQKNLADAMKKLRSGSYLENNMLPYTGMTNIGGALKCAHDILSQSSATKKAVLLFTDGRIEMGYGQEEQSIAQSNEARDAFAKEGTPVFCVGLNKGGSVDRDYLFDLSGKTQGETFICTSTLDIMPCFASIVSYLSGIPQPGSSLPTDVGPDKESVLTFDIYGQLVNECSIILAANVSFSYLKVTDPEGNVVAELQSPSNITTLIKERCSVSITESQATVTFRLMKPVTDGKWTINLKAKEKGNAVMKVISYSNLEVRFRETNLKQFMAGQSIELGAWVYNTDTKENVNMLRIKDITQAGINVKSINVADEGQSFAGYFKSNDFAFDVLMDKPGRYELIFEFVINKIGTEGDVIVLDKNFEIEVFEPVLKMFSSVDVIEKLPGSAGITLTVSDPLTSTQISLPDYLKDRVLRIYERNESADWKTIKEVSASEFGTGTAEYAFSYTPGKVGNNYLRAELINDKTKEAIASNEVRVIANSGDVSLLNPFPALEGLFCDIQFSRDLNTCYEAYDKSQLKFTVTSSNDRILARMNGSTLTITAVDQAEGEVSIRAEHSSGAVRVDVIQVSSRIPQIRLEIPDSFERGKGLTVKASVYDGDKLLEKIPEEIGKRSVSIVIKTDEKEIDLGSVQLSDFQDGSYTFNKFVPEKAGNYQIICNTGFGGEPETASVAVKPSKIIYDDKLQRTIIGRAFKEFKTSLSIEDHFEDSDGDEIIFKTETDDGLTAEIRDGVLYITADGAGKYDLILTASDAYGSTPVTVEFKIEVSSLLLLIIIIAAVVVVLGILIVLFIVLYNKSRIIDFPFYLKVESDSCGAQYHIKNLKSLSGAKAVMALTDIITNEKYLLAPADGNLDDATLTQLRNSGVKISGLPFSKRGIELKKDGLRAVLNYNQNNAVRSMSIQSPNHVRVTVSKREF